MMVLLLFLLLLSLLLLFYYYYYIYYYILGNFASEIFNVEDDFSTLFGILFSTEI